MITVKADPSKRVTYGELIGGKKFNVTLTGNNIDATTGVAKVKPVQELKIVGQSPQRYDIPAKVDGSLKWAVDVKLPGMVHARNVKPPFAGAKLVEHRRIVRAAACPGFVKVVSKGNYVAVVCEREEQAIRAARQLKVNWEKPATAPFPASEDLFKYMRGATPTSSQQADRRRQSRRGVRRRGEGHRSRYEMPFQGHTAFGPAHAMADPSNGQMTIYSNDMKSYGMRNGVATFLGMPRDRCAWSGWRARRATAARRPTMPDSRRRTSRRRSAGPVRMQWMRRRGDGVGHQGPGVHLSRCAAASMRRATWSRYDYDARAADYNHVGYNEPDTVLIAQLMGIAARQAGAGQRRDAVGHVRDSQSPHGRRGRQPAAGVGDAAAHRQPARSERSAVDVRRRVVHRRTGGGGEGRSGGIPPEAAHGQHRPTTAASSARGRLRCSRRRRRSLRLGRRALRRNRAAPATS